MMNLIVIDLPKLTSITLGRSSFRESKKRELKVYNIVFKGIIWVDLSSLQSIELGEQALRGIYDDSCSLVMRSIANIEIEYNVDLPNLSYLHSRGKSFENPSIVKMTSYIYL